MLQKFRFSSVPLLTSVLFALLIMLFVPVFANEPGDKITSRTVVVNEPWLKLKVWGDVQIILSPVISDRIGLEGTWDDINNIGFTLKKGSLTIHAQQVNNPATTKIYVPAGMLQSIEVYGDAKLSSVGYLTIPQLRIKLDGEATVKIRSAGQVKVEAGSGYYLAAARGAGYKQYQDSVRIPDFNETPDLSSDISWSYPGFSLLAF